MKIAAVIYNLSAGGAERVLVNLITGWRSQGHQVTVITLDSAQSNFYALPRGVEQIALGLAAESQGIWQAISNNRKRIKMLREAMARVQPDVVVSFMERTNILTLLASKPLKVPVIVTEHAPPSAYDIGIVWSILRRVTYGRAAAIVSVSKDIDACFKWLSEDKRRVIHNPLSTISADTPVEVSLAPGRKYLIGMGRLSYEKGFDILIGVFGKLSGKYPQWDMVIIGDGAERQSLLNQINKQGLDKRILLPGAVKNPYPLLKQADVFISPSRFEGFGLALAEAMACGLPVVSFDCPGGPAEIIHNGVDGILVRHQDVDELQQAIEKLMSDDNKCQQLKAQALGSIERFKLDKIIKEWDELITRVIN